MIGQGGLRQVNVKTYNNLGRGGNRPLTFATPFFHVLMTTRKMIFKSTREHISINFLIARPNRIL